MENYIVRVYRRDEFDADGLAGLVEIVETGEKRRFHSLGELMAVLQESTQARVCDQVA